MLRIWPTSYSISLLKEMSVKGLVVVRSSIVSGNLMKDIIMSTLWKIVFENTWKCRSHLQNWFQCGLWIKIRNETGQCELEVRWNSSFLRQGYAEYFKSFRDSILRMKINMVYSQFSSIISFSDRPCFVLLPSYLNALNHTYRTSHDFQRV